MKRIFAFISLALLLSSHELFLKSDSYFLQANSEAELYLFNGTFDESENIITRDRIINSQIIGPQYSIKPAETAYYDKDEVTYLKFKTANAGTYVAGISTKARGIELSGEKFTAYLEHEGLNDIVEKRAVQGISDEAANEKYAKHVKALLQVEETTSHYAEELGYPIEFIPMKNPYDLALGEKISFKLLYEGKPLANQTVHISSRKDSNQKEAGETMLKTDQNGEVSFTINASGQWYIATIHMIESKEDAYDYESQWATLTFEVKS